MSLNFAFDKIFMFIIFTGDWNGGASNVMLVIAFVSLFVVLLLTFKNSKLTSALEISIPLRVPK